MYALTKLAAFVVSTLGLASSIAAAAPTDSATPSDLAARAPYDVHNGLASYYSPSIGYGECGWQNKDEEWVAAIAVLQSIETSPSSSLFRDDQKRPGSHGMLDRNFAPGGEVACVAVRI